MQRGQAYFDQGDFSKAGIEFRNAMQIAPDNVKARLMAGHVAERLGQPREAYVIYQHLVDSAPGDVEARTSLARLLVFSGTPERAMEVIGPGLVSHPDWPPLLTVRASARAQLNDDSGARADVDRALKLDPANEEAISLRAALYQRAGDVQQAIDLVSAGVKRLPRSTDLREVLVSLYISADQPGMAEEQLRALQQLKPKELRNRQVLAQLLIRAHKLDQAQTVIEDAVKELPQSDEAKLALVDFLTTYRGRAEGEKVLRGYIGQQPGDYTLRFGLGRLLQSTGATQEAIATYNDIVQRDGTGPKGLMARDRIAAVYFDQGREDDASKLLGEVLAKNPHDNDALLMRGAIELKQHDPAATIADLRTVLRDQPQSVPVFRNLAHAYQANGDTGLAEEALHSAMELAPADTALRNQFAEFLIETSRPERALPFLRETIVGDPTDAVARVDLVRAYVKMKDFAGAKTAAEDLKTLRPKAAVGPYLAGLVAQAQDHPDASEREFRHALELEPSAIDALVALAKLEVLRGRADEAVARVKAFVDAHPDNGVAHNLLGQLFTTTKSFAEAYAQYARAIELVPKWEIPYLSLASAKVAADDLSGAVSACLAGLKQIPYEPSLVANLASIYERQGRTDEAIGQYEKLHEHRPRLEFAANNLAMLLVTYRTDKASLDRARQLTDAFAASEDSSFLDTRGWVRLKGGDVDSALLALERAAKRAPESSVIHYHLGMAELEAGQVDKARSNLEAALSSDKEFTGVGEARAALASLKRRTG